MPRILIRQGHEYPAERQYTYEVLLRSFLGLDFITQAEERSDVVISLSDDPEGTTLLLPDVFFGVGDDAWLHESSLPTSPIAVWKQDPNLDASSVMWPLPVLFAEPLPGGGYFVREENGIRLGLDVFGSAFFMLTRYEELVVQERDEHERFGAKSSIALREDFLGRPLVDEYVEVLWACMKQLWPHLERRQHNYRFYLSCDVDHPSSNTYGSLLLAARRAAGDVVRGRGLKLAAGRLGTALRNARGGLFHGSPQYIQFHDEHCGAPWFEDGILLHLRAFGWGHRR